MFETGRGKHREGEGGPRPTIYKQASFDSLARGEGEGRAGGREGENRVSRDSEGRGREGEGRVGGRDAEGRGREGDRGARADGEQLNST